MINMSSINDYYNQCIISPQWLPKHLEAFGDFIFKKDLHKWSFEPLSCNRSYFVDHIGAIVNILNKFAVDAEPREVYISNCPCVIQNALTNNGKNSNFASFEFVQHYVNNKMYDLFCDDSEPTDDRVVFIGRITDDLNDKPERQLYKKWAKWYPNQFKLDIGLSIARHVDLKKYAFLIDLKGHTYSTRSLWLLASKRPWFSTGYDYSSQGLEPLFYTHWWETNLKPFINYIPVKEDLSDLMSMYHWARDNKQLCNQIVLNNNIIVDKHFTYERFIIDILSKFGVLKDEDEILTRIRKIKMRLGDYINFNRRISNKPSPEWYGLLSTTNFSDLEHSDEFIITETSGDKFIRQTNFLKYLYPNSLFEFE